MVTRNGELVQLSRTEWLLLQHLAANAGKVVLHTELLTKVWGPEYRDDLQYLRVWVSRVRRKLGAKPGEAGRIRTFQGIGYLLDIEPGEAKSAPEELDGRGDGRGPGGRDRRAGRGAAPSADRRERAKGRAARRGPSIPAGSPLCYSRDVPTYDAATALIVVDVQNDFADPAGSLSVRGGDAIVPFVNDQVRLARGARARSSPTRRTGTRRTRPHFAHGRRHLAGPLRPGHLGRGAAPRPASWTGPVVQKGANGEDGYSGFTMRDPAPARRWRRSSRPAA